MDMRIKKYCLELLAACGVLFGATRVDAEVSVTHVTAAPRYPWNGLVDIQCKVSGSGGVNGWFEFAVAAVDAESGSVRDVTHFHVVRDVADADDKEVRSDGEHKLLWDARADLGEVIVSNMIVRVTVRARDKEGHTGVQLWEGGPYWAETNIGAENPWEYGRYFWWGDTVGSLPGGFSFPAENTPTLNKSSDELQAGGWITAAGLLAPEHDAAQVQWGGGWRMPTDQELRELCDKCDWMWTTMNGANGFVGRGRGEFAKASIFVPAAGWGHMTSLNGPREVGCLWSSVPVVTNYGLQLANRDSRFLSFSSRGSSTVLTGSSYRYHGYSIRPVRGAAE